jgi:uncharacterized membrane protein (DUF2068 family)
VRAPASIRSLAGISVIEGLVFLVYAILVTAGVARFGLQGPEAVSNSAGVTLEVIIFLFFGVSMIVVARGWWRSSRWARAPFVLAQMLALVVGVPLMTSTESTARVVGVVISLIAVASLVIALLPRTTAHLYRDELQ